MSNQNKTKIIEVETREGLCQVRVDELAIDNFRYTFLDDEGDAIIGFFLKEPLWERLPENMEQLMLQTIFNAHYRAFGMGKHVGEAIAKEKFQRKARTLFGFSCKCDEE